MHRKYSESRARTCGKAALAAAGRLRRDRGVAGVGRAEAAARRRAGRRARRSRAGVPGPGGDRLLQWRQERSGGRAGPGQRGRRDLRPIRLTDLAARAQLSLAITSELVSDLQRLGYLERQTDGTDRRAKLIFPRRQQALADADDRVAEIEQYWSQIVGPERFAATCLTLQDLLDTLTSRKTERKRAKRPPPRARLRLSWLASRAAQRARTPAKPTQNPTSSSKTEETRQNR